MSHWQATTQLFSVLRANDTPSSPRVPRQVHSIIELQTWSTHERPLTSKHALHGHVLQPKTHLYPLVLTQLSKIGPLNICFVVYQGFRTTVNFLVYE